MVVVHCGGGSGGVIIPQGGSTGCTMNHAPADHHGAPHCGGSIMVAVVVGASPPGWDLTAITKVAAFTTTPLFSAMVVSRTMVAMVPWKGSVGSPDQHLLAIKVFHPEPAGHHPVPAYPSSRNVPEHGNALNSWFLDFVLSTCS